MSSHNPYKPPAAPVTLPKPVNPEQIGVWTGVFFATPPILLTLFMAFGFAMRRDPRTLTVMLPIACVIPLIVIYGKWWGRNGMNKRALGYMLSAAFQGALSVSVIMLAAISSQWTLLEEEFKWSAADLEETLIAICICSSVSLALGLVVRWRMQKATGHT